MTGVTKDLQVPIDGLPVLRVRAYGDTDVGRKRRANEDAYLVDEPMGLYVVCDGMGGHAAGEVASQEAVDSIYGMVKRGMAGLPSLLESAPGTAAHNDAAFRHRRLLESALQAAAYMVYSMAEADRGRRGMGTTATTMLIREGYAVFGQVGDSRIYRFRDGVLDQLTEDHTLVAWQVKHGLITEEEAAFSPQRNVITRAIGSADHVEVDTGIFAIEKGDRFVLCSDGLHGYLEAHDVEIFDSAPADMLPRVLIDLANGRGGKDNITVICVEVS
jgi:protein phosphatase